MTCQELLDSITDYHADENAEELCRPCRASAGCVQGSALHRRLRASPPDRAPARRGGAVMQSYWFEPPDFEMCLVCGTCREAGVPRCENCELRLKELEKQLKPEEVGGDSGSDFWFDTDPPESS